MRARAILAAAFTLTVLAGGCSAGSAPDTAPSTAASTTPVSAPPSAVGGSLTAKQAAPKGANAAPEASGANAAPGNTARRYDASTEAATLFRNWWLYEIAQVPQDITKDVDTRVYPDAVSGVCAYVDSVFATGRRPTWQEIGLNVKAKGYTLSGAAAVVKAAVRSLCTQFDPDDAYRTAFDDNVIAIKPMFDDYFQRTTGVRTNLHYAEIGIPANAICNHLRVNQNSGGLNLVIRQANVGTPGGAPVKFTARTIATSVCPGYRQFLAPEYSFDEPPL